MIATAPAVQDESKAPGARGSLPPLETGDTLHTREFLRRYDRMPEVKKAELIEGTVFMGSPVGAESHGRPDSLIQLCLGYYAALHPECDVLTNTTWVIDSSTTVQPDACLRKIDGSSSFNENSFIVGTPELVVEISASTVSMDNHLKRRAYERAGVREYLVWRVLDEEIDFWRYDPEAEEFRAAPADGQGIWRSAVFPGLVLEAAALLRLDRRAAIAHLS
jgi:Uma2 family endonuclease